ncbi:peptidylprolyl isomerase [Archaeoglobales archaeon]|nr:MAG: peptidylprolyl isomerase [Archaeoglobales archaeon]
MSDEVSNNDNVVSKEDFIRVGYTAKLEDGTVIDSTDEEVAKEYDIYNENARYGDIYVIVGEKHVVKGLDEAFEGKEVGYKGEVTVPPDKGFGEYDPDNKEIVSITRFKEKPQIGQRVKIGEKVGTIERIIGRKAIIDYNHPLAGKNIIFEFEIKEKIEDDVGKVKALFVIHTGKDVEVKIEDNKVIVDVPRDAYFSQLFLIGKYRAVTDIFKYLDVEEVLLVEKFEKEAPIRKTVEEVKGKDKEIEEESKEEAFKGEEEIKVESKEEQKMQENISKTESEKEY